MCQTGLRSVRVGKDCKRIHVGYFVDERACADALTPHMSDVRGSVRTQAGTRELSLDTSLGSQHRSYMGALLQLRSNYAPTTLQLRSNYAPTAMNCTRAVLRMY